jgi:diguanylate cyclase (GGDEF)-like protein
MVVVSEGVELGPVSASMGVAAYPKHGDTAGSPIRAADDALYRAKKYGRGCVRLADPLPIPGYVEPRGYPPCRA